MSLNICIDIASLVNRGDWLMFSAIVEEIRGRFPYAKICLNEKVYLKNKYYYEQKNIIPLCFDNNKKDRFRKILNKLCSLILRRQSPLYPRDIDLVLFSPGFRYSDQFEIPSKKFLEEEKCFFRGFTKKNHKIVFMPQAFGPFHSSVNQNRMVELSQYVDIFYAREESSYKFLKSVLPNDKVIYISPDFTCQYKGEDYEIPFKEKDYVVVIPNRQMILRTNETIAKNYCEWMLKSVDFMHKRGENIIFLNHEGQNDIGLIEVLNASIGNKGTIITGRTGGECKSIISGAKLVVTSRFHGLVSSLTELVPTICTSWSHKYIELTRELGCDCCINLEKSCDENLTILIDALAEPLKYTASKYKLAVYINKVKNMWNQIFEMLSETDDSFASRKLFYLSTNEIDHLVFLPLLPVRALKCFWFFIRRLI